MYTSKLQVFNDDNKIYYNNIGNARVFFLKACTLKIKLYINKNYCD